MPRPSTFFRFDNKSKDSGLSFHCCGKPEDLRADFFQGIEFSQQTFIENQFQRPQEVMSERQLDSYFVASLCNQRRLMRETSMGEALRTQEIPPPQNPWSFRQFTFRSTASTPNLRRKQRVQKFKLWGREISDLQVERGLTLTSNVTKFSSGDSTDISVKELTKKKANTKLKHARSMPLLADFPVSNKIPSQRSRSKCLSSLSYSGMDGLLDNFDNHQIKVPTTKTNARYTSKRFGQTQGNPEPRTSRPDTNLTKNGKFPGFLSLPSWSQFLFFKGKGKKIG
ncbi:hypothetical protein O181_026118 [Austropuccinia psidii MF-1]|uniref:Uncharacterized protein n=1 Tax=Austropuccinia psidii MF-1 TaxID=1389203 RepID=A0A9Q3CP63_9BASI|nr:hypothetical protein [Austropuccinia psidii MF-1]